LTTGGAQQPDLQIDTGLAVSHVLERAALLWAAVVHERYRCGSRGLRVAERYYAHGFREQLLVVVPDRKLIVVRLGTKPAALAAFRSKFMSRVMEDLVMIVVRLPEGPHCAARASGVLVWAKSTTEQNWSGLG
jgi:hypothetical protein